MKKALILLLLLSLSAFARPMKYVGLLPYVQPAPNQGDTNTCWFQASTGAMELLANKKFNIKNPKPGSRFDLAESFLMWQDEYTEPGLVIESKWEIHVQKFNWGYGVQNKFWPFKAFLKDGTVNNAVWEKHPNFDHLPHINLPKIETENLFVRGGKYATGVLSDADIEDMKNALVTNESPLLVTYVDDGYWHVILIVGFDDNAKRATCYDVAPELCNPKKGAFYVRDSNGNRYEARATDWFKEMGNSASIVRLKKSALR